MSLYLLCFILPVSCVQLYCGGRQCNAHGPRTNANFLILKMRLLCLSLFNYKDFDVPYTYQNQHYMILCPVKHINKCSYCNSLMIIGIGQNNCWRGGLSGMAQTPSLLCSMSFPQSSLAMSILPSSPYPGWPPDRGVSQKLYCAFRKIFWLHFVWEILRTESNLKDKTKMMYIADLFWTQ